MRLTIFYKGRNYFLAAILPANTFFLSHPYNNIKNVSAPPPISISLLLNSNYAARKSIFQGGSCKVPSKMLSGPPQKKKQNKNSSSEEMVSCLLRDRQSAPRQTHIQRASYHLPVLSLPSPGRDPQDSKSPRGAPVLSGHCGYLFLIL